MATTKPKRVEPLRDSDLTSERIESIRRKIGTMIMVHPESKAQAKTERKEALRLLDELLQEIEVYHRMSYDNLMGPVTRLGIVNKIRSRFRIE